MAQQTVSPLPVLALLCEEAPVDGHSTWVAEDGLAHAPQQQYEKEMEYDEEDYVRGGLSRNHEFVHEYEVVEGDECDHAQEVWIYEFGTTHLAVAHLLNNSS